MIIEFKIIYNDNPIYIGTTLVNSYLSIRDANHNILPILNLDKVNGVVTIDDRSVTVGDELYISRKDVAHLNKLDDGGLLPDTRKSIAKLYNNTIHFKYIDTIDETPNTQDTLNVGGYRIPIGDKNYRFINYSYYVSDAPVTKLSKVLNLGIFKTASTPLVVSNGVKYIYITVNDRYYRTLALLGDGKLLESIGGVVRVPNTNVFFKCFKYDNVRNIVNVLKEVEL